MTYTIGLLGLGTVGTGTAKILLDPTRRHPILKDVKIGRVGVRNPDKKRDVAISQDILTADLKSIVTDGDIDIVVELIGGVEPARSLILEAIANGKHVVTANKAVISRHGDEIYTAAREKGVYVMLEAAVAGGIPIVQPLKTALGANRIHAVTGIVNGTTNYILTRMQAEGASFDDVLADAQRLGYAEADPTADVDGLDAADKVAILASIAFGGRIKLEDIHCEGIRQVDAADITYADRLGFTIRLLAIARRENCDNFTDSDDRLQVRVHPTLVPNPHPLASVRGVDNAILVEADPLGRVMFLGPGAGEGATASAVVADIANIIAILQTETEPILHPLLSCAHQHYCTIAPVEELVTRFYARFLTRDESGVIGELGTCFGRHGVSLESIVQIGMRDDRAEITIVTHDVLEGNFRAAIAEIRNFEAIADIPSILRVL